MALKNPVYNLMPVVQKQFRHPEFDQAVYDLEQLDLARNFPEKVNQKECIAVISNRFKAFIESLPDNEEAVNDVDSLLQEVKKACEKCS